MKKQYSRIGRLTMMAFAMLVFSSQAYAESSRAFNQYIQSLQAHRAKIEAQLGINPQTYPIRHATSYYDDMEDHYEQDQIMIDQIDKSIR